MKSIDIRSMIIGFLGCLCLFLMMGLKTKKLGSIEVDSILLKDENGKIELNAEGIRMYDFNSGKHSSYSSTYLGMWTYKLNEDKTFNDFIILNDETSTSLAMYNKYGNTSIGLSTKSGSLGNNIMMFNKYGKPGLVLNVDEEDVSALSFMDKYGDPKLSIDSLNEVIKY